VSATLLLLMPMTWAWTEPEEILRREGVRQHERETLVRVSGQPASAVPGDGAEFVDAQQLGKSGA